MGQAGLEERIKLIVGNMTEFSDIIPEEVDIISSIFALHHLPSYNDSVQCLKEIDRVRKRTDCAVWIFDHTRPRSRKTAEVFPDLFTPQASERFRVDSTNSLLASFSFREMSDMIDSVFKEKFKHECSRLLRLYQIHWKAGVMTQLSPCKVICRKETLNPPEYKAFRQLKTLFKRIPFR